MKSFDSINVIPFIDIMLVLLAIVLTTATFVATGKLEIVVPEVETSAAVQDPEALVIALDRDGQFFLNNEAVSLGVIEERIATRSRETSIALHIDERARFDGFAKLAAMLEKNRFQNISVVTRTER